MLEAKVEEQGNAEAYNDLVKQCFESSAIFCQTLWVSYFKNEVFQKH